MPSPYLSVVIALRDDDYPSPLRARVRAFTTWLAALLGDGADGLYELVVVDWNPPPGRLAADAFEFPGVSAVRHIVVPAVVHDAITSAAASAAFRDRPMLDYFARNVGVRQSAGEFVLVTNQDILMSPEIGAHIRARALLADSFYRADRVDVDVTLPGALPPVLADHAVRIHRRHSEMYGPIAVEPGEASICHPDEVREGPVAFGRSARDYWDGGTQSANDEAAGSGTTFHSLAPSVGLHTNAAGDFVLAHKAAWNAVRGYPETDEFYWHIDSYLVCQMWAAGFRQGLFLHPACVFHMEHDRHSSAAEEFVTWAEHNERLGPILERAVPPWLNSPSWGLPGLATPSLPYDTTQ